MLMGKKMILTVLIIPITLGTKTELQILSVFFCPSANSTLMPRVVSFGRYLFDLSLELVSPVNLLWRKSPDIS